MKKRFYGFMDHMEGVGEVCKKSMESQGKAAELKARLLQTQLDQMNN